MNPSAAPAAFEGVSGSITVSVTAFTIVFAVLALVVFAFSAWQLTAAFGFAAEDSISPAYVKDAAK